MSQPIPKTTPTPALVNGPLPAADDLRQRLDRDIEAAGGALEEDPAFAGAIGVTMFDSPASEDNTVTVVLPREHAQKAPSQALLRIKSRKAGDGKSYLGIVTAGPFAQPDNLRADSPLLVTVATQGGCVFLPPFHGRVQVSILGEELPDGTLVPPRLRPLPTSPVFVLTEKESADVLKAQGDIRLGVVVGHQNLAVCVPSDKKDVLPRHLAILGTTGGGKTTTVARLVHEAQAAKMAVILLDVEGEYTHLHEPTDSDKMLAALAQRGVRPEGVPVEHMTLFHLVGRDTTNPKHPRRSEFSLQFARLSPYAVIEMLGMSDAQVDRFLFAYEVTKGVMRELGIFPQKGRTKEEADAQERILLRVDEFQRGHPRLTLSLLLDVVSRCLALVNKTEYEPWNRELRLPEGKAALDKHIRSRDMPANAASWGKVKSLLWRLNRLKVFDRHLIKGKQGKADPINYADLLQPGRLSVVDLSDAGMTELANLAIADLLRGIQDAQETNYRRYEKLRDPGHSAAAPPRVPVIIEEAHEFLSAARVEKMDTLFQQVARIAKRGRKRWLGLVFVTQLPQHLPRQLFGLVNSYVLHKITDPQVVSTLQRTVSGIDASLWLRLPGLAPGQAIVSFPHLARPLLVAIDPAPVKLRMTE